MNAASRQVFTILYLYTVSLHMNTLGWERVRSLLLKRPAGRVLSLPMFPFMTSEEVEAVAKAIGQFFERGGKIACYGLIRNRAFGCYSHI